MAAIAPYIIALAGALALASLSHSVRRGLRALRSILAELELLP